MAKLIVIDGPRRGREYDLGEATIFGRSLDTNVRIPDRTVSRRHAKITETEQGFVVEDLGSGNGTVVNGQLIDHSVLLSHSDKIRIGKAVFVFSEGEDSDLTTLDKPAVSFVEGPANTDSTILGSIAPAKHTLSTAGDAKAALLKPGILRSRLKTVLEISESMQSILDLQELLPKMMDDLFRVFPSADRGLIMLQEPGSSDMVPRVTKSKSGGSDAQMLVSKTIVNEVLRSRMSILSADAMSDQRFDAGASVAQLHIRSVMCVPLIREDEILGLVYIDTSSRSAKFTTDDLDLLTGIAAQAALALQNARMHDSLLKRQRIEREMQFAQDVQKSFLPERVPEVTGFEFSAWYGAALEVGGDFYDFIALPDGQIGIVIGDVSGKGIPAALMMAKIMSDMRFFALSDPDPGKVLAKLNEHVATSRAAEDRFVTLLYIMLDPRDGRLSLANAGHPFPMLKASRDGHVTRLDESVNLPLCVSPETQYTQQECTLDEGDVIAIFTDGVTEAMNSVKNQFGFERLQGSMAKAQASPKAMMEQILSDINEFVGLASPSDDLTIVCFGPVP